MIPLFKSSFSIGKSILTLAEPEKQKDGGPDSIICIAADNGLKEIFLVEDSLTGFLTAFKSCKKHGLTLRFGLRLRVCNDYDSIATSSHKVILFALNDQGFKDISKIFTFANTEKDGIIANEDIAVRLTNNILVAIPFYDSYIWNNYHYFNNCIPSFLTATSPIYFIENNKLPFDNSVSKVVEGISKETVMAKSIYYKNRDDYEAWITYKIACHRNMAKVQTLSAPNLNGCGSKEFCFQSWKEQS